MSTPPSITGFRVRMLIAMMLVVGAVTALALWITQNKVTSEVRQQLQRAYQSHNATLHSAWEARHVALSERSLALARKPRIHAALEDEAMDLLYPNAADELRDVTGNGSSNSLHARFYRFLDSDGKVIPAPEGANVGKLSPADEVRLSLPTLADSQQVGYLMREGMMDEIVSAPIISTETNEVIASIVLGFEPFDIDNESPGMIAGIWTEGRMHLPGASARTCADLAAIMSRDPDASHDEINIDGIPHLVLSQLLNPGSMFPPAYEVCTYSFADAVTRGKQSRTRILSAGALLLLVAGAASHLIAGRLAMPVEQLAEKSARNAEQRDLAEAELVNRNVELQRSMRFSADTSHQLKTPITVLRAGLEELRQYPEVREEMGEEITDLIFQTNRLSCMIHDLLLLSRLDAGRLELQQSKVDLSDLVDSLVDDLTAIPTAEDFDVRVDMARGLEVLGEKRYIAMILQNLLENAWKYNVPEGRIEVHAREEGGMVKLSVGNTGAGIPIEARKHIFERFHRAAVGENVQGHGLGLNIARELALLHEGDLRLSRAEASWTEFEVSFRKSIRSEIP